jgi:hypothetical protein
VEFFEQPRSMLSTRSSIWTAMSVEVKSRAEAAAREGLAEGLRLGTRYGRFTG